jgi:hypothetical protein
MVFPHFVSSLVDTVVMSIQSSTNTPLPLEVDAYLDFVVSHPIQPAVMSMQYLIDNTLMFLE